MFAYNAILLYKKINLLFISIKKTNACLPLKIVIQ